MSTQRLYLGVQLISEAAGLPSAVRDATREFIDLQIGWLRTVFLRIWPGENEQAEANAWTMMCTMQGTLASSLAQGGVDAFNLVAKRLETLWE